MLFNLGKSRLAQETSEATFETISRYREAVKHAHQIEVDMRDGPVPELRLHADRHLVLFLPQ